MAAVTFSWGLTLAVKKEVTGDKEGTAEERGKKMEYMYTRFALRRRKRNLEFALRRPREESPTLSPWPAPCRTFSRFALSFYSLLHFCGDSEQSRYYMSMVSTNYSRCPRPIAASASPRSRCLELVHSCLFSPVNNASYVFTFIKNI